MYTQTKYKYTGNSGIALIYFLDTLGKERRGGRKSGEQLSCSIIYPQHFNVEALKFRTLIN